MKKLRFTIVTMACCLMVQSSLWANKAEVSFVRETNLMVVTQIVKLSFDGKQIGKLFHGDVLVIETETGKHKVETKVGLSLAIPNTTGFNGARKFKSKLNLVGPEHFYKIVFKPALWGGKHHVIEIDALEFEKMSGKKERKNSETTPSS